MVEIKNIEKEKSVYQDSADTLPDSVINSGTININLTPNLEDPNIIPPIGEAPPDHIFDGATTEEDFDAVDALLSLGTVRTKHPR